MGVGWLDSVSGLSILGAGWLDGVSRVRLLGSGWLDGVSGGEHFGHHLATSCLSRYGQLWLENSDELETRVPCFTQWVLLVVPRRMCNVLY